MAKAGVCNVSTEYTADLRAHLVPVEREAVVPQHVIARDVCHREQAHLRACVVRARGDQRGERAGAVRLGVVRDEDLRLRSGGEDDRGKHGWFFLLAIVAESEVLQV